MTTQSPRSPETAEEMRTLAASTTSVDNVIKRRPKGGCYLILNR